MVLALAVSVALPLAFALVLVLAAAVAVRLAGVARATVVILGVQRLVRVAVLVVHAHPVEKWAGQRQRRPRPDLSPAGQPISLSLATARPRTPPNQAPSVPLRGRPTLTGGPGTELKTLLASLGLDSAGGCGCADRAKKMDVWGVAGCEEHREEILAWLRREQAKRGWLEKTKAIALAVTTGLAFVLDPLDPAPGLLDEVLRRARQKEAT